MKIVLVYVLTGLLFAIGAVAQNRLKCPNDTDGMKIAVLTVALWLPVGVVGLFWRPSDVKCQDGKPFL